MLLLAADTSGKNGSIALARGNADGSCEVVEVVPLQGGTFSAQLIPQVTSLLQKHGYGKQNLEGFAVASGPGSFTGLRVGLAAIKGLAEVLGKPIAAVSLLEAVAVASGEQGNVTVALEAGRGELFVGRYEVKDFGAKRVEERLVPANELTALNTAISTPDLNLANALAARNEKVNYISKPIRADLIACLGWKKILANDTVAIEDLDANYIRRSDAEIFSKPQP